MRVLLLLNAELRRETGQENADENHRVMVDLHGKRRVQHGHDMQSKTNFLWGYFVLLFVLFCICLCEQVGSVTQNEKIEAANILSNASF